MREKMRVLISASLLGGVMVLGIGLFFLFIKSGLPYQDPPTDLLIEWMAYQEAGETCTLYGAILSMAGIIGTITLRLTRPKKND